MDSLTIPNLIITTDPKAIFYSGDTLACPGSNVQFVNNSTGINYTSSWSFGDGFTSTLNSPGHSYAITGLYSVKLKIIDQYGCSDSLTKPNYIKVNQPVASYTVNDSISSCTPFEVQFTNTSQYWNFVSWNLGGGISAMANPIQYYTNPGVYQITLVAISPGGCTDTAKGTIQVYDTAGANISYFPLYGCKPLSVNFAAFTPGPMDKYTWDFGDGFLISDTITTINHVYYSFGNFVPKVILTDPSGCIIPVAGIDTIHIKGAIIKFGLDKKFFCDSGFVSFTDSTIYNDSLSMYNWNFGDGNFSNLQNPTHQYTAPGLYTITLNVQTQNACVDTFRIVNGVKIVESPLVRIMGDSIVCVNGFLTHLGEFQRPDTSVVKWAWQFPNSNTSTLQNPLPQQYKTAGNFAVNTIATNSSGCADTATKNIRINPLPVVTLPSTITMQAGFPVLIPATYTSNVVSYNWTPPATLDCQTCPQPTAAPKFNTKYTVSFVDSNGCKNTGQVQVIVICGNINIFVPNTFSPNNDGSNDVFYIRGKGLDRVKSIRIFNRWGEVVFEQQQFPVNDPTYGWNGTYKKNKPIPDVYIYQVEVFCDNSQVIRFEGNVALIQ
jgi:gliding motility-associated-like protein